MSSPYPSKENACGPDLTNITAAYPPLQVSIERVGSTGSVGRVAPFEPVLPLGEEPC